MTVHVSMLRGVTVGGHGALGLNDLKRVFEALGARAARVLGASGDIVFESALRDRERIAVRIEQEIERLLDLEIAVIVRSLDELRNIVERSPLLSPEADPSKLLVMFLKLVPDARSQARLSKAHKGPELIELRGPELYLYYPHGVAGSQLSSATLERALDVAGTTRSWRTVVELYEAGAELERGLAAR